jgi:hypothetical protein
VAKSAPIQSGLGPNPASRTKGIRSLSQGVNQPGRGDDHTLPSRAEVKERVHLYLYSTSGPL